MIERIAHKTVTELLGQQPDCPVLAQGGKWDERQDPFAKRQ